MESNSRRSVVAACLFLGGLVVGSLPSSRPIPAAQAAPSPVAEGHDSRQEGAALVKGTESAALRALRAAAKHGFGAERDDIQPPEWGIRASCPAPSGHLSDGRSASGSRDHRSDDPDDVLAGLRMPEIPVRRHPRVMKYLRYFSESHEGRKFFVSALRRSGRVQELIAKSLREAGLPQELVAVAFVESGFSPSAISSAGAMGIWQFMPQTGRAYGLVVERTYDERASLWHATDAAARHLADLYERFRSWDLALAAYNLGYDGLTRRIEELGSDDFWTLADVPGAMPRETAHYVPKVLAIALLLNNLAEFGFTDVERAPPVEASELEVPSGTRLSLVARASGTSLRALRELNPEFLTEQVPDRGAVVVMHVPRGGLSRARVMLPRLIGEAEDGARDKEVSADFDWGKDELSDGRSRLERTRRSTTFFDASHGDAFGSVAPWLERARGRRPLRGERSERDEELSSAKTKQELRAEESAMERRPEARSAPLAEKARGEIPTPPERKPEARSVPLAEKVHSELPTAPDHKPGAPPADKAHGEASRGHAEPPHRAQPKRAAPSPIVFYRVTHNDTVASIAHTFGLSVPELLAQTRLVSTTALKAGMLLEITAAPNALKKLRGTPPSVR